MRRPLAFLVVLVVAAALGSPAGAGALGRPEIVAGVGRTFAATGSPDGGGAAVSLALAWPVEDRFGFGVRVFADDIGTRLDRLSDPNSGADLGAVATSHRWSYGAAWCGEALLSRHGKWAHRAEAGWGFWRQEDDTRGRTTGAVSATGFTLGLSAARQFGATKTLGLAARYQHVFLDREPVAPAADRYASCALEWRWSGAQD